MFEFGDLFWGVFWLLIGIGVFKNPPLKNLGHAIAGLASIISLVNITTQEDLAIYISNVPFSWVMGSITHYIYLIGANISRSAQMREDFLWGRVIWYGIIIIALILFLRFVLHPDVIAG